MDVSRGNGMPGGCHCSHIVQHVTFRFFHRSKIRYHLLRFHNYLSQQEDARADNLPDHTHHPDDRVDLGKIPALSSQLLPYIWHGVDTDNINSFICQIKEVIHHFIKYPGILIIKIPLVRIKGGHDKMAGVRKPGKIAWSRGREHLRHSFFIHRRNGIIIKKEIAAHIFAFSGAGALRPLMIL